ncbi:MAG: hypothetical protein WB774_15485 [Xanthobacteraceae bacterium]
MENVALDDSGAVQLDAVAVDRAFDAAADAHIVGDDIAFDIGALGDQHLVTVPSPEIFPTIVIPALIEDASSPAAAAARGAGADGGIIAGRCDCGSIDVTARSVSGEPSLDFPNISHSFCLCLWEPESQIA